jgi:hypothetical protein
MGTFRPAYALIRATVVVSVSLIFASCGVRAPNPKLLIRYEQTGSLGEDGRLFCARISVFDRVQLFGHEILTDPNDPMFREVPRLGKYDITADHVLNLQSSPSSDAIWTTPDTGFDFILEIAATLSQETRYVRGHWSPSTLEPPVVEVSETWRIRKRDSTSAAAEYKVKYTLKGPDSSQAFETGFIAASRQRKQFMDVVVPARAATIAHIRRFIRANR